MKIAISAESTSDLTKEILVQNDISLIPYQIVLGDMVFKDGEKSVEELFEYVDKTKKLPKTNAINEFEYTEYFENLRKNYDAVIHICLSSGLSSSCNNALNASKKVENVYVIDSKSLSTGIGLLVLYACELAKQGVSPKEIYEKVSARTSKLQVSFIVERLDYLYKGGRCNSLQLLGANLLKIRPRIVVKDGKMISDKKYKGSMGSVISKYARDTLDEFNTPDLTRVFLTYTTATEDMINSAETALKEAGFKEIIHTRAGGTIASHCGGNTLGVLYFNDGDK